MSLKTKMLDSLGLAAHSHSPLTDHLKTLLPWDPVLHPRLRCCHIQCIPKDYLLHASAGARTKYPIEWTAKPATCSSEQRPIHEQ